MMKLLKKLLSYEQRRKILIFFNRLWVSFCNFLPVRNRVLFFTIRSEGELLDNIKALYNALECKKVIFAHKQPHKIRVKPAAYYYLLTSRVIVTDDYCGYMRAMKLKNGQKLFQIWHGCGAFKCFALDAVKDNPSDIRYEKAAHSQYSAVAVTSEKSRDVFARAFGIDKEKCLAIGLPKTDIMVNNPEKIRERFFEEYPELKSKKIYLYCPTFREKNHELTVFDPGIPWEQLSSELSEDEVFIVNRHPLADYEIIKGRYDNIRDMSGESTTALIAAASAVITDYSSVVHDSTLMGKPMVFFCPDFSEYERNFYIDYPGDLPGEMTEDPGELLGCIRSAVKEPPLDRIEKFRKEQLSACDGHSSERAVRLIEGWLK